jgi:hypothetical protein
MSESREAIMNLLPNIEPNLVRSNHRQVKTGDEVGKDKKMIIGPVTVYFVKGHCSRWATVSSVQGGENFDLAF